MSTHNGNSIFADVFKPNKLQGAGTVAVDTLLLVLANDDILKSCTGTKKEHRVGIAYTSQLAISR